MDLLLAALDRWRQAGAWGAVATVVATWRSAPQPVGSRLLVGSEGELAGSVSGGCVEADVAVVARQVMQRQRPRLLRYGVTEEVAWSVGLTCGGEIAVWVEPAEAWLPVSAHLEDEVDARRAVCVATALRPERPTKVVLAEGGRLEPEPVDATSRAVLEGAMRTALSTRKSGLVEMPGTGGAQVFLDVIAPPPRLLIIGAVHVAQALVPIARVMGFDGWVIDPRADLATTERFPDAVRLIHEWPDRALKTLEPDADSYVVVLSHDPKLDEPALAAAVTSGAGYVGALGSRRTQDERKRALRARGISEAAIARIRGPVGLPIGAQGAEEIALSIMAEIVAVRRGHR